MITPTQCIRFFFETPRLHFSTGTIAIQQCKKTSATKKGDAMSFVVLLHVDFPKAFIGSGHQWRIAAAGGLKERERLLGSNIDTFTNALRASPPWPENEKQWLIWHHFLETFHVCHRKKWRNNIFIHIHWNIQQLKQVRISGPTCTFSWASSKLPSCKSILPRAALPPMSLLKICQSMSVISGIPDVQDHTFVAIDVNHSTPTCPSVA